MRRIADTPPVYMPLPRLSLCLAALTLALAACQAQSGEPAGIPATGQAAPTAASRTTTVPPAGQTGDDLASMLQRAGIRCPDTPVQAASIGCRAGQQGADPGYAVELHAGCGDDGLFAATFAGAPVPAPGQLPAADTGAAHDGLLDDGQFVCIQATARRAQTPDYYYVQAMDPAQVPACAGDATCQAYRPTAGARCSLSRQEGCASGWVPADALEVFSNGIGTAVPADSPLQAADPTWQVLDTVRSGDGRFQLQVLAQPDNPQAARSVRLQTVQADGRVHELARNDRLVPCAACGGVAGDPYAYSRFDDDGLEIVIGGGSRQRWSSHTRWRRPTHGPHWVLEWVQREVVDTQTGQQRSQKLAASALGSPHLADFDPSTLPPAPLLP